MFVDLFLFRCTTFTGKVWYHTIGKFYFGLSSSFDRKAEVEYNQPTSEKINLMTWHFVVVSQQCLKYFEPTPSC